jgi:arylsulfatase A-like enzyme
VDNWIADNGFKLLDRAPDDSPWFLQINFNGPHDPMDITEDMETLVRNKKFPQPTNNSDDWTPREHLATRQNYGAMVENIDARIGDYLDYLEDTDQLDNTLIVYSSDHGEMLGDFDAWAKRLPWQPSIGVPLAIRGPQVKNNQRIEAATEILDVMGTFLDFANVDIDNAMDCKSLRPVLEGETDRVREAAFTGLGPWRAILRDQWKMVVGFDPEKELDIRSAAIAHEPLALYNLAADPWENNNVAGEYPDIVAELSRELPA